jgi:hypothetical protein
VTAFAAALRALHADINISEAATYAAGPGQAVARTHEYDFDAWTFRSWPEQHVIRIVLGRPVERALERRPAGAVTPSGEADVNLESLPFTPRRGDVLHARSITFTAAEVETDELGLSARIGLSR